VATEELTQTQSPDSISDLKPKMRLQGVVRDVQLYGAVVDVGLKYDGVVHISQLAHKRVNRAADVVSPGDEVTVWVTKVEPKRGRIGLTMVKPPQVTWNELEEGKTYTGQVTRIESYGAFVDVGAERPGLLHVREMSSGYVRHPSDLLQVGDQVEVRILKVNRRRRRIDLSMMGLEIDEVQQDEDEQAPRKTTMEIALERAQAQKRAQERGPQKRRQPDLSERESILERTIAQHSKQ
jgi:ribosomal protein S1